MSLPRTVLNLAVTLAILLPSAAFAQSIRIATPVGIDIRLGTPAGVPSNPGHYETRTTQRYVPGFYEQYYVNGTCEVRRSGRHHRRVTRYCTEGYYTQRWVPGHYEPVMEQVWVPDYRPAGISVRFAAR